MIFCSGKCKNDVLKYFCRQYKLEPRGNKADLEDRLQKHFQRYANIHVIHNARHVHFRCRSSGQSPPSAKDILEAYQTLDETKADKPPPRKRQRHVPDASNGEGELDEVGPGPSKKRRGAVDDVSRAENEKMLRSIVFS